MRLHGDIVEVTYLLKEGITVRIKRPISVHQGFLLMHSNDHVTETNVTPTAPAHHAKETFTRNEMVRYPMAKLNCLQWKRGCSRSLYINPRNVL